MPTKIRKLPNQNKYRVYDSNKITAKSTTKENAEKQVRLLRMVSHKKK